MSAGEAAVLPAYRTTVREEWIDYNGHMSEAFYVLVFGHATDAVMDAIGLDAAERERTGSSLYTVEAHVRYLREVALYAELSVTTVIVSAGAKKLHLAHEMRVGGEVVATEEIMALHVGGEEPAASPFAAEVSERIAELLAGAAAAPDWVGRRIG